MTLILLGNYTEALGDAKIAIFLQPSYLKAFFRGKIWLIYYVETGESNGCKLWAYMLVRSEWRAVKSLMQCVVPENIHTPHGEHFCFRPHTPLEFPFQGVLVIPPPPGIAVIFQLGWVPSGKNFSVKNAVALYYYAKDIFFCDKMRIYRFIHVNTVSHNLKDFLSW